MDFTRFEKRKADHIAFALKDSTEAKGKSGCDDIKLIHQALPELDFADVDISTSQLGTKQATPFFVSSMTAGHHGAIDINQRLIAACAQTGWSMGVGSQRRELTDKFAHKEWQQIRTQFPNVRLFGNLGLSQLIETPLDNILRLAESLGACAMQIHLNPLQECLQPEGTPQFKHGLEAIQKLCDFLPIPVVVKETGCGLSKKTLMQLNNTDIKAVDVSGFGGTHWGRIEGLRAGDNARLARAADTFKHWGISTVDSLRHAKAIKPHFELWGSGGVRNGLDAAKLLALGATSIGLAKPLLHAALKSVDAVIEEMQTLHFELKIALFCTGSQHINALQETHHAL